MSIEINTKNGSIHFLLDEYMKRYHMGVAELATLLDKSYNQALNIKNGNINSISFEVLETLCTHFGCQPGQLIYTNSLPYNNISQINKERYIMDAETISYVDSYTPIKINVHLIYALEDNYVLFACPEVEIYGDFLFPIELESIDNASSIVVEHFKDAFYKEKQKYKTNSEFLLRMQQRQHWKLDETKSSSHFSPMPLTYYIENYYSISELINKHKALIINVPLEINIPS